MKKALIAMLGITKHIKTAGLMRDSIRFYSDAGKIVAHKTRYDLEVKLVAGETDKTFDIYVSANEVKEYLKLAKVPEIRYYDGILTVNEARVRPFNFNGEEYPERQISYTEPLVLLDKDVISYIGKAVAYTSSNTESRPVFAHVYMDRQNIVATNTHFLYMAEHGAEGITAPLFFPKDVVPFLAPGTLQTGTKKNITCYKLCAENREVSWYTPPELTFPDYRRIIPAKATQQEFPADKRYLEYVNKLVIRARIIDSVYIPVKLRNILCSEAMFNGTYVQTILKTLEGKAFTMNYTDSLLAPISFIAGKETIILTPIIQNENSKYVE